MIQQEPNFRLWVLTAEIGILWRHIYDIVVTARNTPDTHNNLATGPFSETGIWIMQMEDTWDIDIAYVTFVMSTGACGVVVSINFHRMNFFFAHSIVKIITFLEAKWLNEKNCKRLEKIHINVKRMCFVWSVYMYVCLHG